MKKENIEFNEKLENRRIVAKDWNLTDDLLTGFVRSRIEKFRKKGKWKPNFDGEELEECLIRMVCDIGIGFDTYQGKFGMDYFFRILDNFTMMAIDEEIKRRKNNGGM